MSLLAACCARAGFKRPRASYNPVFSTLNCHLQNLKLLQTSCDLQHHPTKSIHLNQVRSNTSLRSEAMAADNSNPFLLNRHLSTKRPTTKHKQRTLKPHQIHTQLKSRLSFFFSDINLRHDDYSRSYLRDDKYLPLSLIMRFNTIKCLSQDAAVVLEVARKMGLEIIRAPDGGADISIHESGNVDTDDSMGDIFIGRPTPFQHQESLQSALPKIMKIHGPTEGISTHQSRLKDLFSPNIVYWNANFKDGVITVEFESVNDCKEAWERLHSFYNDESMRACFEEEKRCVLNIGDWSFTVSGAELDVEGNVLSGGKEEMNQEFGAVASTDRSTYKTEEVQKAHRLNERVQLSADLDFASLSSLNRAAQVEQDSQHSPIPTSDQHQTFKEKESKQPTEQLSAELDIAPIASDKTVKVIDQQSSHASTLDGQSSSTQEELKQSTDQTVPTSEQRPLKDKWWHSKFSTPSLSKCIKSISELYSHHTSLPPPPREWLHELQFNQRLRSLGATHTDEEMKQRRELCRDVSKIVSCVHNSIGRGVIRALGARDGYAMSEFVARIMLILSESPPLLVQNSLPLEEHEADNSVEDGHNVSPYEACLEALNVLHRLNLDIHPNHYSYAIRAAVHESRFEEAANLFLGQIYGSDDDQFDDSSTGGFVPISSKMGWDQPLEVGLYAVAVDARRKMEASQSQLGGDYNGDTTVQTPSSKVFDTAEKMIMIAPSGHENYVLAAGSALGRAGLWSDCLDFATDPNKISKFGPSIAASAMIACIESHHSAEAIELYNYFFNSENTSQSTASEWQWAGGKLSAAKPLFDDLLLRAMGGPAAGGYSAAAKQKFCDMMDNDTPISMNAMVGLMHSIEHDGDCQSSVQLLDAYCESHYRSAENKWRIVNEMLSLSGVDDVDESNALTESDMEDLTAKLLASTMRVCNKEGFFSLSLLLCSIVHSLVDEGLNHEFLQPNDESAANFITSLRFINNKPIRDAYFQSLGKTGLKRLLYAVSDDTDRDGNNSSTKGLESYFSPIAESMLNALVTSHKVLIALDTVQRGAMPLSEQDKQLISRGVASAMNLYLDANHPASALHLFTYASKIFAKEQSTIESNKKGSIQDTMTTFFHDDRSDSSASAMFESNESIFDYESLRLSDAVLSAVIRAYAMMRDADRVVAIMDQVQKDDGTPSFDTIQSFNNALEVLLDSNVDKFMSLFQDANSEFLMPSTFLAVGRRYARDGAWPEIGELYNKARERGCVSEELGLIAMQAVCEAQMEKGKILVLRKIARDISYTVGMNTEDWLISQYWYIKRYTGFHYARLLMKWNTPSTSQKEELLFAIKEMRRCKQNGLLTKNAPLFCIVKQGELYESSDGHKNTSNLTESQRRAAINIIFEACAEAHVSGLIARPTFTAEVVRSLISLNGDRQCIEFVKTLIKTGERCRHKVAMEHAIKAASERSDKESLDCLINAYESSGFNLRTLTT